MFVIGFLKVIFVTLVAIDTSLIAWIFKNQHSDDQLSLSIVLGIVLLITIIICLLFVFILKKIKNLKDL